MPPKAYMRNKTGKPIDANKVGIENRNAKFICCTDGCDAEMILCAAGTDSAYFRSRNKKDHISAKCVKNSIVFNPDENDESLFNVDFAFESILGKNHTIQTIDRGNTGTRTGEVGKHRKVRIHTLPTLYAMCVSKAKSDTYNGILIDDILADDENYTRYSSGIQGYKVVETTFYFYTDADMSITLNYPIDNKGKDSWVKIIFENKELYISQKQKLFNSMHIEPVIVAGEWSLAPDGSKHHSECIIHKKTQLYYAKME